MTSETQIKQNVALIVIDGWGISPNTDATGDAIRNAKTPVMTAFEKECPFNQLDAHGLAVGLPDGLMGNSEVGHLNIGAGRVVYQDIVRIDLTVREHKLMTMPNLKKAFEQAKTGSGRLHLLGLVSDGGVHSHINHLFAFLDEAKAYGIPHTYIHFFADGRDTSPKSATTYLKDLLAHLKKIDYGTLATVVGRYYAMDRDKRWERVQVAYELLTQGKGEETDDVLKKVQERYTQQETDEFLKPIVCDKQGTVKDGDTLVFFNFRSDRMREINQALGVPPLPFETSLVPKDISITTMTQYKSDFPFLAIFPPQSMSNVLAEWLGAHKIPQCHIAETEKYAHVTFFFNGGTESQYPLEERCMIPSPKVATYDLKPEMSAIQVGQKMAEVVETKKYPFVMCNFAPPDMVGHTGVYDAAIKGVEATDQAIGIVFEACQKTGYVLFVTADHGNAEKMVSDDGNSPHTAHTTSKVPFVMTSKEHKFDLSQNAALCDVAPTLLEVMGLPVPAEMTGKSLIQH
ncbi:phosphoglycerate mutase (2,3-diphosphoglycerate-independent) [Synchytrium endobioticum]|uniref:2,3-bisphosphoglycerate-independent phosphoglycerate mutase n=1 Tax=Synchytrium endobioticum TaxID=286115 RepID=A0A507D1S9_9FUNG|nr:phosphoglycerate mutase (2,3-diphosphoglycerate-independent) [Synchytrium endobioticum]TPX51024.1 phosphoglycerate mutase (2,3-diphosphoglycerate-independent) [Synchytrium endobioticum]